MKINKNDVLEFLAVLVLGGFCWWLFCLVCYVYPDFK